MPTVPTDPAFSAPGRFFKGNLHTHSTRSDGARDPEAVCAAYRDAGYDFLSLTDHFLPKYGSPIVDTRPFRTPTFTTIIGAEVHAPATDLGEIWHILAVGLPLDFPPLGDGETGPALARRCHAAGAYVAIAHPSWYALTAADAATLPSAAAVEIYNHTCHVRTDRADGTYLIDQLLAERRRIHILATDDAHFHCADAFGGFVMVKSEVNEPQALLAALKGGCFYASQGPVIADIQFTAETVEVTTATPVSSIMALGRGSVAQQIVEPGLTYASLPLAKHLRGGFVRIVVADATGRRAWSNPVWF